MKKWANELDRKKAMAASNLIAPDWYINLKKSNASEQEIYSAVYSFCCEAMPGEVIDEELVELMINTYES